MRRADKRGTRGITIVLGALSMLALALLIWREWGHRQTQRTLREAGSALAGQLSTARASLDESDEALNMAEVSLETQAVTLQSLRDRATNLEAQRNHLRAENTRLANLTERQKADLETAEGKAAQARLELLEQTALPLELQSQRDAAYVRIAELENRLDAGMAQLADSPESYTFEGISTDESIFALSGVFDAGMELPVPVYLCQSGGLILDGWLARLEENAMIGHVERWRSPASALVKGEKVFILPRSRHEKDR